MKKIYFVTVGLVISLFVFITCKPDPIDPPTPPPPPNKHPIAKAGNDTSITLATCGSTGNLMLDGSASFDPDNNNSSIAYLWKFLSAQNINPTNISGNTTARPTISNLRAGQYDIELTVTDPGRLFAKDTVTVNVIGSTANGYDLDITINGVYHFQNNYEDCYYCYNPCCYYDLSNIDYATGSFAPIGTFSFYAYEEADTVTANDGHNTSFGLYSGNNLYLYGTSSINLKKVYQSGGGSFSGTFTPDNGSALNCDPNIFKNLAPLTVTGILNATTSTITLNIKGKIYF